MPKRIYLNIKSGNILDKIIPILNKIYSNVLFEIK